MEAAAAHRWGDDLKEKTVCVVGAGKVGKEVIRLLVERRAVVIAADVNHDKAEAAVRTGAVRLIDPSEAPGATADILCPCAVGGLITEDAVPIFTVRSLWARPTISLRALRSGTRSRRLAFSMFLTFWLMQVASSTSPKKPMAMIRSRGEGRRSDPGDNDLDARASQGARYYSSSCGRGTGGQSTCESQGHFAHVIESSAGANQWQPGNTRGVNPGTHWRPSDPSQHHRRSRSLLRMSACRRSLLRSGVTLSVGMPSSPSGPWSGWRWVLLGWPATRHARRSETRTAHEGDHALRRVVGGQKAPVVNCRRCVPV